MSASGCIIFVLKVERAAVTIVLFRFDLYYLNREMTNKLLLAAPLAWYPDKKLPMLILGIKPVVNNIIPDCRKKSYFILLSNF